MHEESIFSAATKKCSPAEREAYLREACGGNFAMQARLAGLLRAHDQPDSFLDAPATNDLPPAYLAGLAHTSIAVDTSAHIGSFIGPYKLRELLGEGGMGVVFVAEQTEPVRRRVALKVIKPGMDTQQVIARFEAEKQALAMMDHPNIARVLDAGTTETGRPYFVMELVRGMPITEYCDQTRLTPRQRLELFVTVCQAVQHAHQKGIIHRDIKPSNILVTLHDGTPVVKVIDFGVARPTTRLVWGDEADTSGALSPDGRYLATTDWETGDLTLRDLATGKTRPVTTIGAPRMANGFAIQPLFSADGSQLAFTWNYRKEGDAPNNYQLNDLRVVSVAGGEPRVVFDDPAKYAEAEGWSADGKWILASLNSAPERQELGQVGVSDKSVRVFHTIDNWRKRKITRTRLSPDGKTIAYSRLRDVDSAYSDILLVDVQSEKETQLVSHAADKHVLGWTPDGRLLYDVERQGARDAWLLRVVDGKPHGEAILMKKDLGTISPMGVTKDGALYYASSSRSPSLYIGTLSIEQGTVTVAPLAAEQFNILDQVWLNDWSPDGDQLAYSARLPAGAPRKAEMRLVSMKTGQKRAFELEQAQWTNRFRWSPDGQSLLGPRWIGESGFGAASIDVATGQATDLAEKASRPIWAREGKGIFYYKGDREPNTKRRIVHRDLQTKAETDVLQDDLSTNLRERSFLFETSPDGQQLAVLSAFGTDSLVLRIVPVAGGAPRELFRGTTGASSDAYNRVLAWTQDGQHLIFKRHGDDTQSGLWYISTDGGEPRKLAVSGANAKQASVLAIHPDGKQVALSISGKSKTDLWALENFLPPLADSKLPATKDSSTTKSK